MLLVWQSTASSLVVGTLTGLPALGLGKWQSVWMDRNMILEFTHFYGWEVIPLVTQH